MRPAYLAYQIWQEPPTEARYRLGTLYLLRNHFKMSASLSCHRRSLSRSRQGSVSCQRYKGPEQIFSCAYVWVCVVPQSCPTLSDPMDCSPPNPTTPRLLSPWDFPGKKSGLGCHFLLQSIFPHRGRTCVSHIAGRLFNTEPPGKPWGNTGTSQRSRTFTESLSQGRRLSKWWWPGQDQLGNRVVCFHREAAAEDAGSWKWPPDKSVGAGGSLGLLAAKGLRFLCTQSKIPTTPSSHIQ